MQSACSGRLGKFILRPGLTALNKRDPLSGTEALCRLSSERGAKGARGGSNHILLASTPEFRRNFMGHRRQQGVMPWRAKPATTTCGVISRRWLRSSRRGSGPRRTCRAYGIKARWGGPPARAHFRSTRRWATRMHQHVELPPRQPSRPPRSPRALPASASCIRQRCQSPVCQAGSLLGPGRGPADGHAGVCCQT